VKSRIRLAGALLALSAASAQAAAPTLPGPERLPADTWVLLNWHGVDAAKRVRATNPVMKLWNDPQFSSTRAQLVRAIADKTALDRGLDADLGRANTDDILSLLENPLAFGVSGDPFGPAPADGRGKVHFYAVMNKKGKEAEWARLQRNDKPVANQQVTTYTFRGVQVTRKVTTTPPPPAPQGAPDPGAQPRVRHALEATLGDLELFSDHQPLLEALITRLQESRPSGPSLQNDAAWQRAQKFRAEGVLFEAFLKVPDISRVPIPPTPQIDAAAAVRELHLERIQGLWVSAGMGRDRMLMRGALLGDFTPGGLLDLVGDNVANFQTLAATPANASYSALRLNLPALYETVLRAVKAGLPPDQSAAATMLLDGVVAAQTGMRTAELLSLFTGEVAVVSTGADAMTDALGGVLMLPSARGEAVLGLIRNVAGGLVQGEQTVAGATVLRIAAPPTGGAEPGDDDSPMHVAVAPNLVVVGSDSAGVQDIVRRNAAGAAAADSMATDRTFLAARRALPAQLNSLNFMDVKRFQWDLQLATLRTQFAAQNREKLERAAAMEKGGGDTPADAAGARKLRDEVASSEQLQQAIEVLLPLVPKYLKTSTGGSWKAADGWYFDSFVD
jgi:hypothetical protein